MLTMKTRYALEALTQLAQRPGALVVIAELAESAHVPRKFLETILRELKQHGLLISQRGRGGGYTLSRAAPEITLASIIQALHGPLVPVACVGNAAGSTCETCRDGGTCSVRLVFEPLRTATAQVLEGMTLADLTQRRLQRTPVAPRHAINNLRYS